MTTEVITASPPASALRYLRRFTVTEYYRMAAAGILHEDDRVELIDGRIVEMAPIGSAHAGSVKDINQIFRPFASRLVTVGVQDPVRLDEGSEPEPDISVLRYRPDNYRNMHPEPPDILLLIEVADTSLAYDREVKIPLYARAGIIETWLVNLTGDCLEVYREPGPSGYQQLQVLGRDAEITLAALPEIRLKVADILPPEPAEAGESTQN